MSPQTQSAEANQRGKLVIWVVMLMSIGMYYVVVRLVPPRQPVNNPVLYPIFLGLSCVCAVTALALRKISDARAKRENDRALARRGFLLGVVLSEAAALYGVLVWFIAASPQYWILLLIGVFSMLLQFPGRTIE